jgi:hypothetical protein
MVVRHRAGFDAECTIGGFVPVPVSSGAATTTTTTTDTGVAVQYELHKQMSTFCRKGQEFVMSFIHFSFRTMSFMMIVPQK